jgi:protein phosphatase
LRLDAAFRTDIGRKRKQNQDSGIALPERGFFLVADGMGGHRGGETASSLAVEIIPQAFERALRADATRGDSPQTRRDPRKLALAAAIREASATIHERACQDPKLQGMGTTACALLVDGQNAWIANVGDSRCYLFRRGQSWQLTEDHTLVQEKFRAGIIGREQLRTDQMKNVITRSVGFEAGVEVDVLELNIRPGDVFLLCSDGLSGPLDEEALRAVIDDRVFSGADPAGAAERLIQQANDKGGDDNITALVVLVS